MEEEKWHYNAATGKAERCTASKRPCPIGGPHYGSRKEVEDAIGEGRRPSGLRKPGRRANKPASSPAPPVLRDAERVCRQLDAKGSEMLSMFNEWRPGTGPDAG